MTMQATLWGEPIAIPEPSVEAGEEFAGPPRRVQLSRETGWRMPANTVKVDRSTKFGNPYRIGMTFNDLKGGVEDRAHAVKLYRAMYELDPGRRPGWPNGWRELIGKSLACWCPIGEPCHADVLLELVAKWAALSEDEDDESPLLVAQHRRLKERHPDTVIWLRLRLGIGWVTYNEDADLARAAAGLEVFDRGNWRFASVDSEKQIDAVVASLVVAGHRVALSEMNE